MTPPQGSILSAPAGGQTARRQGRAHPRDDDVAIRGAALVPHPVRDVAGKQAPLVAAAVRERHLEHTTAAQRKERRVSNRGRYKAAEGGVRTLTKEATSASDHSPCQVSSPGALCLPLPV